MADTEVGNAAPLATGAATATSRPRLIRLATDAFVRCFLVALWVSNAANAVALAARWVGGEESRAAAAIHEFAVASCSAMGMFFCVAAVLLFWSPAGRAAEVQGASIGGKVGDAKRPATQPRRPESTGEHGFLSQLYAPIPAPMVILLFWVIAVGMLMEGRGLPKGSFADVGSILVDIGIFIHSVMFCFFIFPNMVSRMGVSFTKLNG
ncbi:hypothetical protein EJB05_49188 [Eragrostis curvula]|uniref:Uncharacterized protein n=1 Tax=Eragrostis curvula TaxID=38414 RepID=A0A5J9T676_9POAL|nr:hypothetical protein EJB05_49188 [Eragrostis curvula]